MSNEKFEIRFGNSSIQSSDNRYPFLVDALWGFVYNRLPDMNQDEDDLSTTPVKRMSGIIISETETGEFIRHNVTVDVENELLMVTSDKGDEHPEIEQQLEELTLKVTGGKPLGQTKEAVQVATDMSGEPIWVINK